MLFLLWNISTSHCFSQQIDYSAKENWAVLPGSYPKDLADQIHDTSLWSSVDVFYEYQQKHNQINNLEKLNQQRLGVSFTYVSSQQFSANGEVSLYENNYEGPVNSPIIYQLLEGLLPGKNWVWRLLVQRNITNYLDVNLNYQGRQNETSKTIHTGSVQLRAHF